MDHSLHVDVCLTSISSRIAEVHKTISTILSQDYPSFNVYLYLSDEPFLLDKGVSKSLPESLQRLIRADKRFQVRFVPNWGPYRKAIPYLMEHQQQHRVFVTADDDTIYPSHWLSGLVEQYKIHRCIICYRGHAIQTSGKSFMPYRRWMTSGIRQNPDIYIVPTGKDGVLYDTTLLHPRIIDVNTALKVAPTADDLWFKWHSAAVGTSTFIINSDYSTGTFDGTDFEESLYQRFNKGGKNDDTLVSLSKYSRDSLKFDMLTLSSV
ncbi:hypothetical protein [Ponticaulis profundi]|uniref:Glycosyltransferase 2-like domain-containing protein n=1 Tax=Ponticaulis profundi TaxID=2665222 RepID=A0ABW1SEL0_9PROT